MTCAPQQNLNWGNYSPWTLNAEKGDKISLDGANTSIMERINDSF